ncbi:MAG: DUF3604 domain-containing protein [Chloroflexota bacterium]
MNDAIEKVYRGLQPRFGDIHNHCDISYGHGSLEDAFANARLQLDFASVTGHAYWPDMPRDDPNLGDVVAYHERGFARLASRWDEFQEATEANHRDGEFVTFLSFEWHSMRFGDHCVYYPGSRGEIIRAADLPELRAELRRLPGGRNRAAFAIPHHIGYRAGWRGIDWATFTPEFSPVVEMMSMHGCAESDDAPRPYLHTMGPRDAASTVAAGLAAGHEFGLIGSTDHHSAHPGSHGHGRLAVWAAALTREAIWDAIDRRRTYALTGDRIELAFAVNGVPMGGRAAASDERLIVARVVGGGSIDYVEVVRNGQIIHRQSGVREPAEAGPFSGLVGLAVGWGERGRRDEWDVELEVVDGQIDAVEPRFRGDEVVAPRDDEPASHHFSSWERTGDDRVHFATVTRANPTTTTDATQSMTLRIVGDDATRIRARFNGVLVEHSVSELRRGSRSGYVGGFLSGAYLFRRAVPDAEATARIDLVDVRETAGSDAYRVRVRQTNDQWAWSSPIWISG